MKLYMIVTPDKYQLPMAVADSYVELARIAGVTAGSVLSGISRARKGTCKHAKYVSVEVDDWEPGEMPDLPKQKPEPIPEPMPKPKPETKQEPDTKEPLNIFSTFKNKKRQKVVDEPPRIVAGDSFLGVDDYWTRDGM